MRPASVYDKILFTWLIVYYLYYESMIFMMRKSFINHEVILSILDVGEGKFKSDMRVDKPR